MCGFSGFVEKKLHNDSDYFEKIASDMAQVLPHRGPDSNGIWFEPTHGVGFSHTRLSIHDLTISGHQPMLSSCGRFVIAYNGEIYNFLELKEELDALNVVHEWKGHSDTEVLLALIKYWGLSKTLRKINGMFAFALWDCKKKTLSLARDRFGEKPLYFGFQKNTFLFGSELKALRQHPSWDAEIDRGALTLYMRYCYVPAPLSIYKGISKLLPGHYITVKQGVVSKPIQYWSLSNAIQLGKRRPFDGSRSEAVSELNTLLHDAVNIRTKADVPVGVFLSGGVDSSTVASIMQSQSTKKIRTFAIGLDEKGYNEAPHAKKVAKYLGTDHTELYLSSNDALDVIPQLPEIYDEPFADSSQIPTYFVSKMTREYVTVALSGDGGDELFGGYTRYFRNENLWKGINSTPLLLRRIIRGSIENIPPQWWDRLPYIIKNRLPGELSIGKVGDRLHKLACVLDVKTQEELFGRLISTWQDPEDLVLNGSQPETIISDLSNSLKTESFIEKMMYFDSMTELPDDILTKVDRASMAVSLESRIPLLDHRVAELAWKFPLDLKVYNGVGKWVLREVLHQYVPPELIERPKQGFSVPISDWLRGPLRDWAEALLDPDKLKEQGYLNVTLVHKYWDEHLSNKKNWPHQLWAILMFQAWLDNN
jgi:asparagine synthase (glutamine-hydrolysing)